MTFNYDLLIPLDRPYYNLDPNKQIKKVLIFKSILSYCFYLT